MQTNCRYQGYSGHPNVTYISLIINKISPISAINMCKMGVFGEHTYKSDNYNIFDNMTLMPHYLKMVSKGCYKIICL